MKLAGKTALVTGAALRIGRATALALGGSGADVVVHYRASEEEAHSVVRELSAQGVRSAMVKADLADPEETGRLFRDSLELNGRLDILVNSASIFDHSSLSEARPEEFRRNLEINAVAPFLLARALYDHLGERGEGGAIINFLDTRITDYDRLHVPYAVSKRALHTLTQMMAREYAPQVRVNAVAPGLILPPSGEDESYLERLKNTNPLNTYGTLEQITDSVLFLLGNAFVTGQTIWVDGGRHLAGSFYGQ